MPSTSCPHGIIHTFDCVLALLKSYLEGLTALIADRTGGLTSRLARCLTLSTSTLFHRFTQRSRIQTLDVFHHLSPSHFAHQCSCRTIIARLSTIEKSHQIYFFKNDLKRRKVSSLMICSIRHASLSAVCGSTLRTSTKNFVNTV